MNLISGTKYLLDSNILVYLVDQNAVLHNHVKELINVGFENGVYFVVAHQNLLEFIAVLTRAYRIDMAQAIQDASIFASRFDVIIPLFTTFQTYISMMEKNKVVGYPFDLYLAATMLDNGVSRIITNNVKDFHGIGLDEVVGISS